MAILKNVTVHYVHLARPNSRFNETNPTWEVECRTADPAQKDEWIAHGLRPRLMVYKEGHEKEGEVVLNEQGQKQWKMNLKKNSKDKDGNPATKVEVVNGLKEPVDPATIGGGSVAHIKVFLKEYTSKKDGKPAIMAVLKGLQLKVHRLYVPTEMDEFDTEETEIISDDDDDTPADVTPNIAPSVTKTSTPAIQPADARPADAF